MVLLLFSLPFTNPGLELGPGVCHSGLLAKARPLSLHGFPEFFIKTRLFQPSKALLSNFLG